MITNTFYPCMDNHLIINYYLETFIYRQIVAAIELVANFSCSVAGLTQCFNSLRYITTPRLDRLYQRFITLLMVKSTSAFAEDISVEPIYYDQYTQQYSYFMIITFIDQMLRIYLFHLQLTCKQNQIILSYLYSAKLLFYSINRFKFNALLK